MTIVLAIMIGAASFTDTFEAGQAAYEGGNYPQAIKYYEELVYNRVYEPEVFYNLGNAYYQQGDYASAMVNYERAWYLSPGIRQLQDNIDQTRMQTEHQLARPPSTGPVQELYFWHHGMSSSTSLTLAVLMWLLMWGGFMAYKWKGTKYLRRSSVLLGILALLFWGSWYLKTHPMELAVARGDDIPVRIGMKETDTIRFELNQGDRVQIDAERGEFVRVITATGDRGWVNREALIPVWPPYRATGI